LLVEKDCETVTGSKSQINDLDTRILLKKAGMGVLLSR
jgi:hypothetical protein